MMIMQNIVNVIIKHFIFFQIYLNFIINSINNRTRLENRVLIGRNI